MAETTKIQWCDATFNPWIGCSKVSPGCANCYAERDFDLRKHVAKWGAGQPRHRTSVSYWKEPLKWNRHAPMLASGVRPRVFCGSLCDWLDDEVPVEWLADLLDLIRRTPNLDWLLLTQDADASPRHSLEGLAGVSPRRLGSGCIAGGFRGEHRRR